MLFTLRRLKKLYRQKPPLAVKTLEEMSDRELHFIIYQEAVEEAKAKGSPAPDPQEYLNLSDEALDRIILEDAGYKPDSMSDEERAQALLSILYPVRE